MPWSLEQRDGEWCVIKDADGSSAGCHSSRSDAIKQQRALYANESRMASMYDELDAQPEVGLLSMEAAQAALNMPELEPLVAGSRVVKIEIPTDEALTASVMAQMERMNERQARTDQALVAALEAIGAKDPVVNVHQAPITIEPAQVHVPASQVTVNVPEQAAPVVNVPPAQITVNSPDVNVSLPERQKTVTFERDPLTQQVTKAEVTEA